MHYPLNLLTCLTDVIPPAFTAKLPAHFTLWLVSQEAAFLKGRTVWANWDVEELKTQAATIPQGLSMTSGINGWPFTPSS